MRGDCSRNAAVGGGSMKAGLRPEEGSCVCLEGCPAEDKHAQDILSNRYKGGIRSQRKSRCCQKQ